MSKYYSKKVTVDGQVFDSVKEYRRWCELVLLQKAGQITNLERQVSFELLPAQYRTFARYGKKGQRIKDGKKCIEHSVVYNADFVYTDKSGAKIVEDTKSKATRTKDYVIKRKLMLWVYGIKIREV